MKYLASIAALLIAGNCLGQVSYERLKFKTDGPVLSNPILDDTDYQGQIIHLEAPNPNGDSYRSFLMRQKQKQRELHPLKEGKSNFSPKSNVAPPLIKDSLRMYQVGRNGNVSDIFGGIPNDNTLAVSNDGIVVCGINSTLWAYDSRGDSAHFKRYVRSLKSISNASVGDFNFDPKIMYDPDYDRWILIFLQNYSPTDSRIKICFSTTNDPADEWNVYTLPGNPLDNNRWSDFPAMTITKNEVFLTLNLIIPNVSWQVGFDGSIIWQMDKRKGYAGAPDINPELWHGIKYDNKYIRNLHAVWGAEGIADEAIFLSNRNFDLSNDSIFIVHLTDTLGSPDAQLDIKVTKTDLPYGVPPNGRQSDTDTSDATKGLQTNDARVLGAISKGNWIQYVANTLVPETGFSGIYHGFINDVYDQPSIHGEIISDPIKDFGYPNIAWTGDEDCDIETMIGFNHASFTDFPGVSAIYYSNDGAYSEVTVLKEGENFVDRLSDSYERWGDYFGMQRKYNEPKTAWLAGYFANNTNRNVTWVSEIASVDSNHLELSAKLDGSASLCKGSVTINGAGGIPPYSYSINGQNFGSNNVFEGLCSDDSVTISVQDIRGCVVSQQFKVPITPTLASATAFPVPSANMVVFQFEIKEAQTVEAAIFDQSGNLVDIILNHPVKQGRNELKFSLEPLTNGVYIVRLTGNKGFSHKQKIIKSSL